MGRSKAQRWNPAASGGEGGFTGEERVRPPEAGKGNRLSPGSCRRADLPTRGPGLQHRDASHTANLQNCEKSDLCFGGDDVAGNLLQQPHKTRVYW